MNWWARLRRARPAPAAPDAVPDSQSLLRTGYACLRHGDRAAAELNLRAIPKHDTSFADACFFLGRIAFAEGREEEAIALLQQALESRPREAVFIHQLASFLFRSARYEEAVTVLNAGLALLPDAIAFRNLRAAALIEANRREEARPDLEALVALQPDAFEAHFSLGGIYREYGRSDEAIASYRRVTALEPGNASAYSNLLLQLNYSPSLDAASIFADHRRFGETFARRYELPQTDAAWPRRLRIGYLSPDFRNHVVMRFMEPVLACHDRDRFEVFCYHNHKHKDAFTERLRGLAVNWVDCEDLQDHQLADRIRADRVDILIDLAGHTVGNGLPVMALKPAPVQASYLGYPNTTGLPAVDYRISDAYCDPPGESDKFSTEKILRLPGSYFCYQAERSAPPVGPLPAQAAGHVTFGCFSNFAKLSGPFLDLAARVLGAVPDSRLLLKARPLSIEGVAQTLRAGFARAGIDPARIETRGWEAGTQAHLSIYNAVDIALDTLPYNGATTTCESLWMGVPMVSLAGDRHVGRTGLSLLNAAGLGELVTSDPGEYVAICARLAGDLAGLATLRAGLRERMQKSSLMDKAGFTRKLEACYLEMWDSYRSTRAAAPPDARPAGSEAEALARARRLDAAGDVAGLVKMAAAPDAVAEIHHMLGCALQAQGKIEDAFVSFNRAIELEPGSAKAHNNLGCLLEAAGKLADAEQRYRQAARLDPGLAHALYNLGNLCKQKGEAAQAIGYIEQALALEPEHADWRSNLGNLQYGRLMLDEAVANFQASIGIDPRYDRAYVNLGAALVMLGRIAEAESAFRKALELKPEPETGAWLLLLKLYRDGEDAQALFEMHRAWAKRHASGLVRGTGHHERVFAPGRRVNVGYVSPDFVRHPVAHFIGPVLAAHDASAFNIFCYSNADREDEVTLRLREAPAYWRDISELSDADAADQIRADSIDILVDLAGHTGGGRLLLFALKPAPVQIGWLGYPNTTGLDTMDYRLSDAIADPPGRTERFHSEKLVRLPRGFLCYAPPRESPGVREPAGSGEQGATFGCFNNLAKVTPEMIALWAELMRRLPDARLILKSYGLAAASARRELRGRFLDHGIGGDRVDLRPAGGSPGEHLSTYGEIDIALDVFPYNGTTTTCEALWMGVPVVTLAGSVHVSRVSASILNTLGLADLVADSPAQYLEVAQRLALDAGRRRELRAGMRARMQSSPLLDAAGFARDLESAYRAMLAGA